MPASQPVRVDWWTVAVIETESINGQKILGFQIQVTETEWTVAVTETEWTCVGKSTNSSFWNGEETGQGQG